MTIIQCYIKNIYPKANKERIENLLMHLYNLKNVLWISFFKPLSTSNLNEENINLNENDTNLNENDTILNEENTNLNKENTN